MEIAILPPQFKYSLECATLSDKIFMELLKDSDPIDGIMRLYDEAVNKREYALAMAATLLVRHRQWQCAIAGVNGASNV